jgi:hypothetical protein
VFIAAAALSVVAALASLLRGGRVPPELAAAQAPQVPAAAQAPVAPASAQEPEVPAEGTKASS